MKEIYFLLLIMLAGCQTFKDAAEQQFDPNAPDDDGSGEWFRERAPDTTKYEMSVKLFDSLDRVMYSKSVIAYDTITTCSPEMNLSQVKKIEFSCKFTGAKPLHKISVGVGTWSYFILMNDNQSGNQFNTFYPENIYGLYCTIEVSDRVSQ